MKTVNVHGWTDPEKPEETAAWNFKVSCLKCGAQDCFDLVLTDEKAGHEEERLKKESCFSCGK